MPGAIIVRKVELVTVNASGKLELAKEKNPKCKATQTTPRWDILKKDPVEPLAIDIEFQTFKAREAEKWSHRMGRISLVNTTGDVVYDTFVRYPGEEDVATRANPRFGVTRDDLRIGNGAQWIDKVETDLKKIMSGRVIVGHGMKYDLASIDGQVWKVVGGTIDTQNLYGQIALGTLVGDYLGNIEFEWHDPTHDAKATMLLYLLMRPYKGRTAFQEKLRFTDEEFPALGSATAKKKRHATSHNVMELPLPVSRRVGVSEPDNWNNEWTPPTLQSDDDSGGLKFDTNQSIGTNIEDEFGGW